MAFEPHPRWPGIMFLLIATTGLGALASFWFGCAYIVISAVRHLYCAG